MTCFSLQSMEQTRQLACSMAHHLVEGLVILLDGPMGSGKTTLTSEILAVLGYEDVRSPTFALVHQYDLEGQKIFHADFYRLEVVDLRQFALDEELDDGAVLIVEWPDRLNQQDFENCWRCKLTDHPRSISIQAHGSAAQLALNEVEMENGSLIGS